MYRCVWPLSPHSPLLRRSGACFCPSGQLRRCGVWSRRRVPAPRLSPVWWSLLICSLAVFVAVLRASHRARRARLTPSGGWSLPPPPTRGAAVVSHSCSPLAPLSRGGCIPRPVGAEWLRARRALFCRLARGVARPRPAGFPPRPRSRGLPRGSVSRVLAGSRPFLSAGARRILRPTGAPFCP